MAAVLRLLPTAGYPFLGVAALSFCGNLFFFATVIRGSAVNSTFCRFRPAPLSSPFLFNRGHWSETFLRWGRGFYPPTFLRRLLCISYLLCCLFRPNFGCLILSAVIPPLHLGCKKCPLLSKEFSFPENDLCCLYLSI